MKGRWDLITVDIKDCNSKCSAAHWAYAIFTVFPFPSICYRKVWQAEGAVVGVQWFFEIDEICFKIGRAEENYLESQICVLNYFEKRKLIFKKIDAVRIPHKRNNLKK